MKKNFKKINVLRLRADEICYIKSALETHIEENIYREDGTGFELVKKFNAFISERPRVFSKSIEFESRDEEEEDRLWG